MKNLNFIVSSQIFMSYSFLAHDELKSSFDLAKNQVTQTPLSHFMNSSKFISLKHKFLENQSLLLQSSQMSILSKDSKIVKRTEQHGELSLFKNGGDDSNQPPKKPSNSKNRIQMHQ